MAHKTLIGGTAYEINGGRTLIGGTGYEISCGKTLVGGTGYDVSFGKPFADYTWAEIIEVCQSGNVPSVWNVGDQKPMTINGVAYTIDIIGKKHDIYSGGSGTAPLTFQLHDCYNTKYQMNSTATNVGGYDSSLMHTTHLPAIKALMPTEVQAAIRSVDKLTGEGNKGTAIETISCDLFLLSGLEVLGHTRNYSYAGEGSQYAYYANGGSVSKDNGDLNPYYWWLRTPCVSKSTSFCYPFPSYTDYSGSSASFGVSFAFCF